MEKRAPQACDACRFRKVKCNGERPCSQCNHLYIDCVFTTSNGKRHRPVRGRLLAQLRLGQGGTRESQRPITIFTDAHARTASENAPCGGANPSFPTGTRAAVPSTPSLASADLDDFFFISLIPSYERFAYPVNPIMTSDEILDSIPLRHDDPGHAAFVYAFAAVTINLTETSWTLHGDISARIQDLMARSIAAKQDPGPTDMAAEESVTIRRIMTCVFLEICAMAFKRYDRAFLLLSEAISLIHLLRVERGNSIQPSEPAHLPGWHPRRWNQITDSELARRQRLYWEAFVHQRFLAIVSGYPATMPPLRTGEPMDDPSIPRNVQQGFSRIVCLFQIIDAEFLSHWMGQDLPADQRPPMTASWVERKQKQLDDDEADTTSASTSGCLLTELQHADLFVTRLWLRTLVWQLGMSRCLLSSVPPASSHEAMSLVFPARRLSAQLRLLVVEELDTIASIGMHGSGILQKLFEITNTIADVLALVPDATTHPDGGQTIEDFVFLVKVLFSFERIDTVLRQILRMKIQAMGDMLGEMRIQEVVGSD